IPADGNTTSGYTATVLDQYGAEMGGEAVTWSLDEAGAGISINETSGQVTVTDEADEGTFTVVATSNTNGDVSGSLQVSLGLDDPVVTNITVSGDEELALPTEENTTMSTYTASVLDQYGSQMDGEAVTWSLDEAGAGISIDGTTGEVTVTDEAEAGDFTVVATSDTDTNITGELVVTMSLHILEVTSIEVTGDETLMLPTEGNTTTSTYTSTVLDQYGQAMDGEEVTWSLDEAVTGVSIDATTGQVTITDEAEAGDITVVATSDTDGGVTGILEVTLSLNTPVDPIADNTTADVPDGKAGEETTITITVLDGEDDPVTGADGGLSVTIAGANEDAELTDITDNGDGTYTVSYTPTHTGIDEISITLDDTAISESPYTSEINPAEPESLTIVAGDDQDPQPTRSWMSDSLVVRVTDRFDNPVAGAAITFEYRETPDAAVDFEFHEDEVLSDGEGLVKVAARLGSEAGSYIARASSDVEGVDPVEFTFEAVSTTPDPEFLDIVNTMVFSGGLSSYIFTEFNETQDQPEGFNFETWVLPTSLDSDGFIVSRWDDENEENSQYRISVTGNVVTVELMDDEGTYYELEIEDFFRVITPLSTPAKFRTISDLSRAEDADSFEWTHISLVVDPDNEIAQIYRNGFEMKRTQFFSNAQSSDVRMEIGRQFAGEVHEIRLWDRPRTRSGIQATKDLILTGTEENLVLYQTFDDDSEEDVVRDLTPNGNHFYFDENVGRKLSLRNVSRVTLHQNEDFIVRLAALDETEGTLEAEVLDLPKNGRLYQVDSDMEPVEEITEGETYLTETLNRSLYKPNDDFAGVDTIRYRIYDQYGNNATSVMEFEVLHVNRPPVISRIGGEDRTLEFDQRDSLRIQLDTLVTDNTYAPEEMIWEIEMIDSRFDGLRSAREIKRVRNG
ncbi:MAG: filamin/ABP280 repeat domain-containing protein, partial [Balneolaceae bacterium]